jgi:hypothetical protein
MAYLQKRDYARLLQLIDSRRLLLEQRRIRRRCTKQTVVLVRSLEATKAPSQASDSLIREKDQFRERPARRYMMRISSSL